MKTRIFGCALTLVALLLCAAPAQAEMLWSYNFDSLSTVDPATNPGPQNLTTPSQDGWVIPTGYSKGHQVVVSPDPTLGNGNVLKHPLNVGTGGVCGSQKPIGSFTFDNTDTAIEQYVWLKFDATVNAGKGIRAGVTFANTANPGYAIVSLKSGESNEFPPGYPLRVRMYPDNYGNPSTPGKVYHSYISQTNLTVGDWYEFKGVMDFSVPGVQVTWYIRDITTGETGFSLVTFDKYDVSLSPPYPKIATDLTSINMALAGNGDGTYTVNSATIVSQGPSYNMYADNFRLVDPVPEPSTLSLLAAGLVGLICYAWRKRK